jgi:lipid A disaccharide synthetase
MLRTARALRAEHEGLRTVLPHQDPTRTPLLREMLLAHGADFVEHHEGPLAPWLQQARLVLVKSGTGSLEACLLGAPTVVVYQLSGMLSTLGYHNILSVPWIAAANLIAGRAVVPEFCFHGEQGWLRVLAACRELWADGPRRAEVLAGIAEVQRRLRAGRERGGATARAAAVVREFLGLPSPLGAHP